MDVLYVNELERFINEVTLSFEVPEATVKALGKYTSRMRNEPHFLKEQKDITFHHLKCYLDDMLKVVNATGKVKADHLLFLNKIKLFNNLLCMSLIENENKNTKKQLIKNLYYQVYKCCEISEAMNLDTLKETVVTELAKMKDTQAPLPQIPKVSEMPQDILEQSGMSAFLNNSALSGILDTTVKSINESGMNPLEMVSEMLSGNVESNEKLSSLMTAVSGEIQSKMSSGELNEQMLMDLVSSGTNGLDLASLMGNLGESKL